LEPGSRKEREQAPEHHRPHQPARDEAGAYLALVYGTFFAHEGRIALQVPQ
jgi:hypothetical protein